MPLTDWLVQFGRAITPQPTQADLLLRLGKMRREIRSLEEKLQLAAQTEAVPDLPRFAGSAFTDLITEYSSDLISIHKITGEYVYVSPNSERFFGWSSRQLLGQSLYELVHPDEAPELDRVDDTGHLQRSDDPKVRYRIRTASGTYRWVETRATNTDDQQHMVCITRDVHSEMLAEQQRASLADELRRLAYTDSLTALPNRLAADEMLRREFSLSFDLGQSMAAAIIDVDKFKLVNDTKGHQAGDEVLKATANAIQDSKRDKDFAARWAGDEFIVIQPHTREDQAFLALERLRESVGSSGHDVTLSIGVADSRGVTNVDELLHRADTALYRAKALGRNRVISFEDPR